MFADSVLHLNSYRFFNHCLLSLIFFVVFTTWRFVQDCCSRPVWNVCCHVCLIDVNTCTFLGFDGLLIEGKLEQVEAILDHQDQLLSFLLLLLYHIRFLLLKVKHDSPEPFLISFEIFHHRCHFLINSYASLSHLYLLILSRDLRP
jgi:hypothetical protein